MSQVVIMCVSVIAATLSAVAAVVVAVVAVRQLRSIFNQNRDTHDWNRRKTTIDMATAIIQGEQYRSIRAELREHGFDINDQTTTSDKVMASLSDEHKKTVDVLLTRLFNLFECFCVALRHNLLDETIAKDMLMLYFIAHYEKYRPYLLQRNQRETQAGAYGDFLCCAKQWETEYRNEVSEQADVYVYRSKRDAKQSLGE